MCCNNYLFASKGTKGFKANTHFCTVGILSQTAFSVSFKVAPYIFNHVQDGVKNGTMVRAFKLHAQDHAVKI